MKRNWFKVSVIVLLVFLIACALGLGFSFIRDGSDNSSEEVVVVSRADLLVGNSAWIVEVSGGTYYTDTEPNLTEEGFLVVTDFCRVYNNGDTREGTGDIVNGDWIIYPRSAE